jgi:hypothetical protein
MKNTYLELPNSVNKMQLHDMYIVDISATDIVQTAQEVMRENRKDFKTLAPAAIAASIIFPAEFKIIVKRLGLPSNYQVATATKKPLPYTISKKQAHKLYDDSVGKQNATNVIKEILQNNNRKKTVKCLRRSEFEQLLQLFGTPTGFYSDEEFKKFVENGK